MLPTIFWYLTTRISQPDSRTYLSFHLLRTFDIRTPYVLLTVTQEIYCDQKIDLYHEYFVFAVCTTVNMNQLSHSAWMNFIHLIEIKLYQQLVFIDGYFNSDRSPLHDEFRKGHPKLVCFPEIISVLRELSLYHRLMTIVKLRQLLALVAPVKKFVAFDTKQFDNRLKKGTCRFFGGNAQKI